MDIQFPLHEIMNIHFMDELMNTFYEMTGHKLKISFNSSKGYLSYLDFKSEGVQSDLEKRRIFLRKFETLNKDGSINKKVDVRILHDNDKGLTIEVN